MPKSVPAPSAPVPAKEIIEKLTANRGELKKKKQRKPQIPAQRKASTIPTFCLEHGFSRSTYYNLKAKGLTPRERELTPGGRKIITEEDAAEWRAQLAQAE